MASSLKLEQAGGAWRLDCLGLLCPVPIVQASRALRRLPVGAELLVLADDPGAPADLRDWADANRQELLGIEHEGDRSQTRLRKVR